MKYYIETEKGEIYETSAFYCVVGRYHYLDEIDDVITSRTNYDTVQEWLQHLSKDSKSTWVLTTVCKKTLMPFNSNLELAPPNINLSEVRNLWEENETI